MVTIRTGELTSAKDTPRDRWRQLVNQWQRYSYLEFPDDCSKLKQMRDECVELGMWEELGYDSVEDFFGDGLLLDYRAVDLACMALAVTSGDHPVGMDEAVEKGRQREADYEKIKALAANTDMTQQAIADEVGKAQQTVSDVLTGKQVRTPKTGKPKRKVIRYEISQYTKPETAARRIREVFGEEFAESLRRFLVP